MKNVYLKSLWALIFTSVLFFFSCIFEEKPEVLVESVIEEIAEEPKEWTILVYMAADNNLESVAIKDINEMEASGFNEEKINLFVLLDRSSGGDASNGDWSDTRLLKIKADDSAGNNIVSERIGCEELGLTPDGISELDMADSATVAGIVHWTVNNNPAKKVCLIIWGHGSGWRYFCTDDYSGTAIQPSDLRIGIEEGLKDSEKKLDVLCLDTCFGMTIEVLNEFKDICNYVAGTPGIEGSSGWNYGFLGAFSETEYSEENLLKSIINQFSDSYKNYEYGSFTVIKTELIEEIVFKFNELCGDCCSVLIAEEMRNEWRKYIQNNAAGYEASVHPCDFYLNFSGLIESLKVLGSEQELIVSKADLLSDLIKQAAVFTWNSGGTESEAGVGIYYSTMLAEGIYDVYHPSSYVYGSKVSGKCSFISDCRNYVPTAKGNSSLLDILFYKKFKGE